MTILRLENVSKVFTDGSQKIEALKATNFSASKGELIAIIGPSGSGKSTFLTIVGGLLTPSTGEIVINNKKMQAMSESERSKTRLEEIGFVLQTSNLVPFLTVQKQFELLDRVKKGNMPNEELRRLYHDLGIESLKNKYPNELSGGQRQRVAIAKALYTNPSIVLADEPTASLDSEKAFEVMELLKAETKNNNTTTLVVTHDVRLIDYFDAVYEMTDGVLELQVKGDD